MSDEDPGRRNAAHPSSSVPERPSRPGVDLWGAVPGVSSIERWGRYENLEHVGEGGVGVVYRAWDPTLQRDVALKMLRREGAGQQERLFREARAQARLEHPNICPVYEAGSVEGTPFLAMQFIEGQDLRTVAPQLALEQRVRLLKLVAEAVHSAHRLGLVHRDLKPGNILVETTEDGDWKPYVMDFGLVRDEGASIVTQTGEVLGTPAYMAPEQVEGDARQTDRRSDVYSLGAMLYELLVGTPPFGEVSPLQAMMKVVKEEPEPPRRKDASVPEELEIIALKCLEKEPQARYGSARALADELGRFLDGEPILAQPVGRLRRLVKKARKNRTLVLVTLSALTIVVAMAALSLRTRWQASERAGLAQRFGQDARDVEWMMRVAHMSPLHDIAREKARVRERIRGVQERMDKGGALAEAPGLFALGRGLLALGDLDEAHEHLERAWDRGARQPEVAFALGLSTGRLYRREIELTKSIRESRLREARRLEVERVFREPTLRFLRASRGSDLVSPSYLEGLIALHDGRFEEGLLKAEEAVELFPWLYEARILEGDLHLGIAKSYREDGDLDQAMASYLLAEAAFVSATQTGASDVLGYEGLCDVRTQIMIGRQENAGSQVEQALRSARDACEQALVAEPGRSEPRNRLSVAYRLWGGYLIDRGLEPLEAFERAATQASLAIETEPGSSFAHESLGSVMVETARWEFSRGDDPRPTLALGIESLERAGELTPVRASTFDWIGSAHRLQAWFEWARGLDPEASWERALPAYQRAIEIEGETPFFVSSMADLFAVRASYGLAHGSETREDIDRSIELYQSALAKSPHDVDTLSGLGTAHFVRAEATLQNNEDPALDVEQSRLHLERAIELRPGDFYPPYALGYAALLQARYDLLSGKDPSPSLDRSFSGFDSCLALNPRHAHALTQRANGLLVRAEYRLDRGQSPDLDLEAAGALLEEALVVDPSLNDAHLASGEKELLAARSLRERGNSPTKALERAENALELALEANANDARSFAAMAALVLQRCQWQQSLGRLDPACADTGLEAATRALAINPRLVRAQELSESLRILRVSAQEDQHVDRGEPKLH